MYKVCMQGFKIASPTYKFEDLNEAVRKFKAECFNELNSLRKKLNCGKSFEEISKHVKVYYIVSNDKIKLSIYENKELSGDLDFNVYMSAEGSYTALSTIGLRAESLWGFSDGIDYLSIVPKSALDDGGESLNIILDMVIPKIGPVISLKGSSDLTGEDLKRVALYSYLIGSRDLLDKCPGKYLNFISLLSAKVDFIVDLED